MGGAHPGGKLNGRRAARKLGRRPQMSGRSITPDRADGRKHRVLTLRSGMAQVLPFKGGWLIVVEGIANPFIGYQVKMSVAEKINE
jgi:hypothetical protein